MEPERWKQAEELFERGLEADAEERERLLGAAAPDVAAVVGDLWRRQTEVGSFLEHPVATPPVAPRQFVDGHTLAGRFKITGFLGTGGMGEVYSALDERLGRTVAIKVLHAHLTDDPELRNRFEREARAVCSLNHPRICALHDVGWEGAMPFLVMEHLSGETLSARLARGRLPLHELLAVGEGVADALAYAHQHGVIHRDLKPSNIMLTEHGPKLLDFGIAKRVIAEGAVSDSATTVTQTAAGMIVGSAAYMSPEQAEGRQTDHRSDVFSFGTVLYEMATGRRAFQGDTHLSTLAAVLQSEPSPLRTLAPASPPALDRIVGRCLRKNREDRYPEMAEVCAGLQGIAKPSNRWRWVAAGVAAVAVIALASVSIWRRAPVTHELTLPKAIQLTADQGASGDPTLSPDGEWLAYVSDRGDTGNWGVWIQRLDGSERRKLAECKYAATPVFTPDGESIMYACGRGLLETDLHLISAKGGKSSLLVRDGQSPSTSPDGRHFAYLDLKSRRYAVKPISGGEPVRLPLPGLIGRAVWSPNGEQLLALGDDLKFFVARRSGGAFKEIQLREVLDKAGLEWTGSSAPLLYAWTKTHVYLSFRADGSSEIWRVPFDAEQGVPTGAATRITAASNVSNGSILEDKVVFEVGGQYANLFSFQLGTDNLSIVGKPRQLTFDSALTVTPSLSRDGRTLSYIAIPSGKSKLLVMDVDSGRTSLITELPASSNLIHIAPLSADGKHVAWAENNNRDVYVSQSDRPTRKRICSDCGYPLAWMPDGQALILCYPSQDHRNAMFLLDVASGRRRAIMNAKDYAVQASGVSRDGSWIAFQAGRDIMSGVDLQLFVAPINVALEGAAVKEEESDWIRLRPRGRYRVAAWSSRGDSVFVAEFDQNGILAIPLNERTKYPIGPSRLLYKPAGTDWVGWLSSSDRSLVAMIGAPRCNIWIQDLPK